MRNISIIMISLPCSLGELVEQKVGMSRKSKPDALLVACEAGGSAIQIQLPVLFDDANHPCVLHPLLKYVLVHFLYHPAGMFWSP